MNFVQERGSHAKGACVARARRLALTIVLLDTYGLMVATHRLFVEHLSMERSKRAQQQGSQVPPI
jgi:hypothetical protein